MSRFIKNAVDFHHKFHEHVLTRRTDVNDVSQPRVGHPIDITIKFIQGSGLPKMDPGPNSFADPYIIANIDGKTSYVSTAQPNTLNPVWNETWMIANVPSDAKLRVDVYDKDEGSIIDDYIGSFTTWLTEGAQVQTLKGLTNTDRGVVGFNVSFEPSKNLNLPQYSFNGPIRYSRHFSPTAGAVTKLSNPNGSQSRLWSTWKIALKGVPVYFGDNHQHWNIHYKAAQTIFQGALSFTVRAPIQAGHRLLYARKTSSTFGIINDAESFWSLFRAGEDRLPSDPLEAQRKSESHDESRVKPAVYTYVIGEDETFRFSETGASFFVDFASKHALHSCCAETVRYSGEFHPRPVYPDGSGWASFSEETPDHAVQWELVIDNNSGTYAPDKKLLPALKSLFEFNFPGLRVIALDFQDDVGILDPSRKACREYAVKYRGVATNQLQPSATLVEQSGGGSLFSEASKKPAELIMGLANGPSAADSQQASTTTGPGLASSDPPAVAVHPEAGAPTDAAATPSGAPRVVPENEVNIAPIQPPVVAPAPQQQQAPPGVASGSVPPPIPEGPPPAYDQGGYNPSTSTAMPDAKIWRPPPQAW